MGKNLLELPAVTDALITDKFYMVRGVAAGRDKQIPGSAIIPTVLTVAATGPVDLSSYKADLIINASGTSTITFSNDLVAGKRLYIMNTGVGTVTLAGSIVTTIAAGAVKAWVTDGATYFEITSSGGGSSPRAIQIVIKGDAYADTGIAVARIPYAMTGAKVRIGSRIPPTGSALTIDINYSASNPDSATPLVNSILTSPPLSLSATSHTAETTSLAITALAAGGWLVFDIDAEGSTLPGTDIIFEVLE